ncbi:MAG: hypothetical protein AB7F22_10390 [Reyranella sp.]|uniref:hypothetical protein n=1 Tax=Reyranella sp. TaxID=1929291 RepID=UPI003D0BDBDC
MNPLDQRWFLGFAYWRNGTIVRGAQVVVAPSLADAADRLMIDRGLDSIRIERRFWTGEPASEAVPIGEVFGRRMAA